LSQRLLFNHGWDNPECWGVWSIGPESDLSLKLDKTLLSKSFVKLNLQGNYHNGNEKTRISINGLNMGMYELNNKTFWLARDTFKDNRLQIHLTHQSYLSPAQLGISQDERNIKYGLTAIEITAVDQHGQ